MIYNTHYYTNHTNALTSLSTLSTLTTLTTLITLTNYTSDATLITLNILTKSTTLLKFLVVHHIYNNLIFFQAEDGIRDCLLSRGLGDVYKRQKESWSTNVGVGSAKLR